MGSTLRLGAFQTVFRVRASTPRQQQVAPSLHIYMSEGGPFSACMCVFEFVRQRLVSRRWPLLCICVLIHVSSYYYARALVLLCVSSYYYVSSYYTSHVSSYNCMCPHTAICVLILLSMCSTIYVSAYYFLCVLMQVAPFLQPEASKLPVYAALRY